MKRLVYQTIDRKSISKILSKEEIERFQKQTIAEEISKLMVEDLDIENIHNENLNEDILKTEIFFLTKNDFEDLINHLNRLRFKLHPGDDDLLKIKEILTKE